MVEILKNLVADFLQVNETPLQVSGQVIGYQSVLLLKSGYPFAGGTHEDLNVARRICAAEAIERSYVNRLRSSDSAEMRQLILDEAPTSCGFAAGFEERPTVFRAICEAVERWAWSQWIDNKLGVMEFKSHHLATTELQRLYMSEFEEVRCFRREVHVEAELLPDYIPSKLIFSVVLGLKNGGVFPGSRVTSPQDDLWSHPLLEAWRHLHIFKNELQNQDLQNIFDRRIYRFGKDGRDVIQNIPIEATAAWPKVRLRLLKEVARRDGYFVWRALAHNYEPWHKGDENRFIY